VQTVLAPAAALSGAAGRVVYFAHELPVGALNRIALMLPSRWVVACSSAVLSASQRVPPHRDGTVVWPAIEQVEPLTPEARAHLLGQLGLGERPVIGVVGRLLALKGQDRLIDALALLYARGTQADLLIVGGEAHGVEVGIEQRLRAQVTRLGLERHVTFTGQVESARSYIELMDVLVSASDRDGFGITVVEAMAAGVPVVAVGIHGPAEIVDDGVSGVLTRTADARELADAIESVLGDPAGAERLAAGGRARFEALFQRERMLSELGRTLAGAAEEAAA
jgi:glycosyltransferase involved in cell wall biosynthesis